MNCLLRRMSPFMDPQRTLGRTFWGRLFALSPSSPSRKVLGFAHKVQSSRGQHAAARVHHFLR